MEYRRFTAHPPQRGTVIYDGECGFCKFWVNRWQMLTRDDLAWLPFQKADEEFPDVPRDVFESAVQLIKPTGEVIEGAEAVLSIIGESPKWRPFAELLPKLPLAMPILRTGYRFIARNRGFFSRITRLIWGSNPTPSTFAISRRFFAGALGAVFIAAFTSLAVQVRALFGSDGIMPAAQFLGAAREQLGSAAYSKVPTIFWADAGDTALMSACLIGILFGGLLMFGFWPAGCSVVCWILYLSLCSAGSPFLNFQWDALLLETSLVAAVFLPWSLRPRWREISTVSRLGRLLLAWLLFRLMLESGAVKLASGDPAWAALTALGYHFETQPLPLWTSWYAHHAPLLLQKAAVLGTFAIEFIAPLGIFAPRRVRHLAAWAIIALQVAIIVTGNYAFFNWLTIALCFPLFDDTSWPASVARRPSFTSPVNLRGSVWPARALLLGSLPLLTVTGAQLVGSFRARLEWPEWLTRLHASVAPLRSFNSYGLFAVMTTDRPEIVIEGSNDGQVWHAYQFKWKPGDVKRPPALVAPHQPRIDWQMWFAALSDVRHNPWFVRFLICLLKGSPDVLDELAWNPFPDKPPKYLRAVLYDYRFTSFDEPGAAWWTRKPRGIYCPPVTLSGR